jgi:hypothetical protein
MTGLSCPRAGCPNSLAGPDLIVCTGDFLALAGMCRGKKRLGQPEADMVAASKPGRDAYACHLCREYHTGSAVRDPDAQRRFGQDTVQALRDDPRMGPAGLLALADAWHPDNVNRSCWHEGLDQRVVLLLPSG